jgi:hypothetical protein
VSRTDYEISKHIMLQDYPFYALVMAAMRQADTHNVEALKQAFPETWGELVRRYNAPGGVLPEEAGAL